MKIGEICDIVAYPDYTNNDGLIRRYELELLYISGNSLYSK